MITKKLKDEIYAWDPNAFKGKGYWFVLGAKGGLGRAASKNQSVLLGKPPLGDTIPESPDVYEEDTEKKAKEEAAKKAKTEAIKKFKKESVKNIKEEVEEPIRGTGRSIEYRKKDREYADAEDIRRTGLTRLIAQKMISGESLGGSIKGSISDKTKATLTGIREKFDFKKKLDSLNIAKALGGNLGATIFGRATGRSTEDISYFTGIRPNTQNLNVSEELPERLEPTFKQSEPTGKRKRIKKDVLHSKVSPGRSTNVAKGDSISDVLAKLYNLKFRQIEEEKKRFELQNNFKKERELEKQNFLDQLLGKLGGKKEETKPTAEKVSSGSGGGMGGLMSLIETLISSVATLTEWAAGLARTLGPLLGRAALAALPMLPAAIISAPFFAAGFNKEEIEKDPFNPKYDGTPYAMALRDGKKPEDIGVGGRQGRQNSQGVKMGASRTEIEEAVAKLSDQELTENYRADRSTLKSWLEENPKKEAKFKIDTSNAKINPEDLTNASKIDPSESETLPSATEFRKMNQTTPNVGEQGAFNRRISIQSQAQAIEDVGRASKIDPSEGETLPSASEFSKINKSESIMDSNTRETPIDTPAVPEPKSELRLGQYDESGQTSMGTTTLVNSPVTNIINNGGGDIGIESLASIRTIDITMKKLQFANYRTV